MLLRLAAAKSWPSATTRKQTTPVGLQLVPLLMILVATPTTWCSRQTSANKWQQQLNKPTTFPGGDDEPAIVINSKHSGSLPVGPLAAKQQASSYLAAGGQQLQQRRFPTVATAAKTQPQRSANSQSAQPSQEFDSIPPSSNSAAPPAAADPRAKQPSGQSSSFSQRRQSPAGANAAAAPLSLIRDTSELVADTLELDQRRAQSMPPADQQQQQPTSTSTESNWMQSVRDNHHGPLRSRFNLHPGGSAHSQQAASLNGNTRRLVSGEQVTPVGDNQQLVLDGHMKTKPGPSQPVPYEQQLAKSVRTTDESTTTTTTPTPTRWRRNSKFTRRSTEYATDSTDVEAKLADSTTTPLSNPTTPAITSASSAPASSAPASSQKPPAAGQTGSGKVEDKTKGSADFKTVLVSNNHRPSNGIGGNRKPINGFVERKFITAQTAPGVKVGRKLELDRRGGRQVPLPAGGSGTSKEPPAAADRQQPSEHRQQQQSLKAPAATSGWSRLLPNLLHRTLNSVFKRLAPGAPPSSTASQQAVQTSLFNSFAAPLPSSGPPLALSPAPVPSSAALPTPAPSSLGMANLIASALSAAFAAAAATNSNHSNRSPAKQAQQPAHHPAAVGLMHNAEDGHHQLMSDSGQPFFSGAAGNSKLQQMAANSMRHETKIGLRQHANKKIIDSFVDLPVSERRTGFPGGQLSRREGLLVDSTEKKTALGTQRRARMSSAVENQEFELDPPGQLDESAAPKKGNGSWSLEEPEPAAEFYLGANLTAAAIPEPVSGQANTDLRVAEEESAATGGELDEDDQLDFRTTTDSSAAGAGEETGDANEDSHEEDEPETLESSDSILVPDRMAYEVAHDLGEPPLYEQLSAAADAGQPVGENAAEGEDPAQEDEEAAGGFSLFYAPAPSELMKSYRREPATSGSMDEGEGSFARIFPAASNQVPRQRQKGTPGGRPQLSPLGEPISSDNADEGEDGMQPMTLMMVPTRRRQQPARRRPSSAADGPNLISNKRNKPAVALTQPGAVTLKETRNKPTASRNRNKATTSKPMGVSIFTAPKIQSSSEQTRGEMMSPMSSSISVMDLDPSMTRLAHNKLIVAKFKPNKFKQQQQQHKKPAASQQSGLLHRSASVAGLGAQPARSRPSHPPLSLSSALLGNSASLNLRDDGSLSEMVSRRWQSKPRLATPGSTTPETDRAEITDRPPSQQENSTWRAEPDHSAMEGGSPLRIVSDFQFLMPGLASGLAARISSLTRPLTSTTTTTTSTSTTTEAPPSESPASQPPSYGSGSSGDSAQSHSPPPSPFQQQQQQPFSGNRNDKFNFSLIQMNNRERINPLLFPIEKFSNSSSYSLQQQQKQDALKKPSNHRSRLTTTTQRPATSSRPNITTADSTGSTSSTAATPIARPHQTVRTTSKPVLRSTSTTTTTTTTTVRPTKLATSQRLGSITTTTTFRPADDDSLGQILRNQHHRHTSSYKPPPPRKPLTESERLRNQYLGLIGKNSSLDGRTEYFASSSSLEDSGTGSGNPVVSLNPLGHMSLIEAAHDANRYLASLDSSAADEPADSIVIMSDNHHSHNIKQQAAPPSSLSSSSSSSSISRLPPFNAGHTRYELLATSTSKPSSSPPAMQETARKYLEEFVNGTRIRPSSMSKLVAPPTSSTGRRGQQQPGGAFNSVQGSPPSPGFDSSTGSGGGRLDPRVQELLLDVYDRDPTSYSPSSNPRKVYQQQNSSATSSSNADYDRIKTHSTITLTPVPPVPDASAVTQASGESTTSTQFEATTPTTTTTPAPEPASTNQEDQQSGGYSDLGESGDLNNRASMRKNQAKIQSILAGLAANASARLNRSTTPAPNSDDASPSGDDGGQEFKTTLAATDYSDDATSSMMETTRFYAPTIKLTTRSSHFRPQPMSTPAPGRVPGFPVIETLSGSRQKINKPAMEGPGGNFEYSPAAPQSSVQQPTSTMMPTTKLTESLTNDSQLKQTIKNRLDGGYSTSTAYETGDNDGQTTPPTTIQDHPTDDQPATISATESVNQEGNTETAATAPADPDLDNRRKPIPSNNELDEATNYTEMPAFPQSRPQLPARPIIIRRRPTKRPPPHRLAIAPNQDDNQDSLDGQEPQRPPLIVASKPRRRRRPTKRPQTQAVATQDQDRDSYDGEQQNNKRKVIYRPLNVAELGESPMLIRKQRPSYLRLPPQPPENIRIHSSADSSSSPAAHRNHSQRPAGGIAAPVSIILPAGNVDQLKRKDHDIRTRPLTIMDPPSTGQGDHLTNEAILNPAILTRIPETTIMHNKLQVSYKPGRPLPGSMSSFSSGGGGGKLSAARRPQPQPEVGDSSSSSDGFASGGSSSSAPAVNGSALTRPPQLGSGNGGDTHLISIEQQQREQQQQQHTSTSTRGPQIESASANSSSSSSSNSSQSLIGDGNHRPIIVISGLFGNPSSEQNNTSEQPAPPPSKPASHHEHNHHHQNKRPNSSSGSSTTSLASNSLLEAGSLSVVAQASHGQANSSRPWYPTAAVSSWPNKNNSSADQQQEPASNSTSLSDLSSQSSSSVEQSVFGGADMPSFGGPTSGGGSSPSGSYQNHHLQHQHIGMPGGNYLPGSGGSRPNQQGPNRWRVRRRPQGNQGGPGQSAGGSGGSSAGYNFNSASSVSNYVYRPLLSSINSFGVLFDNLQIFFARIRTFIISLMVMFLPPLALAASIVNAMSV